MKDEKDLQSREIGEELDDEMLDSVAGGVGSSGNSGAGDPPYVPCGFYKKSTSVNNGKERAELVRKYGQQSCATCRQLRILPPAFFPGTLSDPSGVKYVAYCRTGKLQVEIK